MSITTNPLGALRSKATMTLHSHYSLRIWQGRAASEENGKEIHGILSMKLFIMQCNEIKRAAAKDNPYADMMLIKIEEKLKKTDERLQIVKRNLEKIFAKQREGLTIEDNLNVTPLEIPIMTGGPLGFLSINLLLDGDEIIRKILLAQHTGLLGKSYAEEERNHVARLLRSLCAFLQEYKPVEVTRKDFREETAKAKAAMKSHGELPEDVLEGTRRAKHAPDIREEGQREKLSFSMKKN